jgi:hypothetical protein
MLSAFAKEPARATARQAPGVPLISDRTDDDMLGEDRRTSEPLLGSGDAGAAPFPVLDQSKCRQLPKHRHPQQTGTWMLKPVCIQPARRPIYLLPSRETDS